MKKGKCLRFDKEGLNLLASLQSRLGLKMNETVKLALLHLETEVERDYAK